MRAAIAPKLLIAAIGLLSRRPEWAESDHRAAYCTRLAKVGTLWTERGSLRRPPIAVMIGRIFLWKTD